MTDDTARTLERALEGVDADTLRDVTNAVCQQLIGKGLSFRQAEAVLDYAKDLLKNAKI